MHSLKEWAGAWGLEHGPHVPIMYLKQPVQNVQECVGKRMMGCFPGTLNLLNWLNAISGVDGSLPIVHDAHHLLCNHSLEEPLIVPTEVIFDASHS